MALVSVNGTRLWVEDSGGPGVPIVLSHSLFFDSTMFDPLIRALGPGFRIITYDHRSQGRSLAEPGEELGMDVLAEDAASLIRHLGAAPCHFVGNSLGGFVALRLAIRRPDLLRSAAILGSSAEAEHRLAAFVPVVEAMRAEGPKAVLDTLMFIMFGDSFLADPARAQEREHWRARLAELPPAIAYSAAAVIFRRPVLAELAGCRVPFLALAGEEDHAYGAPEAERAAVEAGGRWTVVPQAGHSLALEQPEAVSALLAAHFERAEAAHELA